MSQASAAAAITIAPEERGLAVATHLSGLAGYVIPFGGVLVPVIIWAVKKDSRVIAALAKQAVLLNIVVFAAAVVLALLCLTIILIPLAILGLLGLAIVAIALPVVGAIRASEGVFYRYPVVGTSPEPR